MNKSVSKLLTMTTVFALLFSILPPGKLMAAEAMEEPPAEFAKLQGTTFGLPGGWGDSTYDKMFDGNTSTIFDYVEAGGGYAGMDLGADATAAKAVKKIRFFPRDEDWVIRERMAGGKFQGSNVSETEGFEDLYVIDSHVHRGWNDIYIDPSKQKPYRYLRYLSAANGYVNLAEAEFYTSELDIGRRLNHLVLPAAEMTLLKNESRALTVTGIFSDGTSEELQDAVSYDSSDPAIATVTPEGRLTALDHGSAVITIQYESLEKSLLVKVGKLPAPWAATDIVSGEYGPLQGTVFGIQGETWGEHAGFDTVFDGNTNTFFDSKVENGAFAGLDFGEPKAFNKLRFHPRGGYVSRANQARIEGSANGTDYELIHTISQAHDGWNEIIMDEPKSYRYVRFVSPNGGYGNMAEMAFISMPISDAVYDYVKDEYTASSYGLGIGDTQDHFQMIHQLIHGAASVTARLEGGDIGPLDGAKAGLIAREDAATVDARYVFLGQDRQGHLSFEYRSDRGAAAVVADLGAVAAPVWLKLDRTGDTFKAFTSADRSSWTEVGTIDMALPAKLQFGLAASSGSSEVRGEAVFSHLEAKLAKIDVHISPGALLSATTSHGFSLNGFNSFNPEAVAEPAYLEGLQYMKPGLFRLHGWHMMDDSATSANGWLVAADDNAWDGEKIDRLLDNLVIDGDLMINIPSWPESMDIHPGNGTYDMLAPEQYEAFADWCAQLVRIVNVDHRHGVKYWEITNEKDDGYYVHLVNNGQPHQMGELAKIYNLAAKKMKDVDPAIQTGGPAFARPDLLPSIASFVSASAGQTDYPEMTTLDFLSYHFYGSGDKGDSDERIYNRATDLYNNTLKIREILDAASPEERIELYLDEYNVSWSYENNDPRMLNHKGGVFDALVMIRAHEAGADGTMAWNEKDGIYGKMDGENRLRLNAHVYHMFNAYLVGDVVESASSAQSAVIPFAVKRNAHSLAVALVNRTDDERMVDTDIPGVNMVRTHRYTMSASGYEEAPNAAIDLNQIPVPPHSVTVLEMEYTSSATAPVVWTNPSPEPGTITVNEPQAHNGKIVVQMAEGTKQVLLPASSPAIDGNNTLVLEGERLIAEMPTAVLKELQAFVTDEQWKDARISIQMNRLEANEWQPLLKSAEKGAGARLKAASSVYELALAVVAKDGQTYRLSEFQQPVTLKLKVDEAAADPDLLGIYYIAQDGALEYAGGKLANGYMVAKLHHFSMYSVLEYSKSFADVPDRFWAADAIKSLTAKQVIKGINDREFAPNLAITRAEFAALLVRALKLQASGEVLLPFVDVEETNVHAAAIAAAYEAGVIKGKSASSFMPEQEITREEMAVMLERAMQKLEWTPDGAAAGFTDHSSISPWAARSVTAMTQLGIIQGFEDGSFRPDQYTTRAQAVVMLSRLLKRID